MLAPLALLAAGGATAQQTGSQPELSAEVPDAETERGSLRLAQRYEVLGARVVSAAFSPDGATVVTVSRVGELIARESATGVIRWRHERARSLFRPNPGLYFDVGSRAVRVRGGSETLDLQSGE